MPEKTPIQADEHDYSHQTVGVELLQKFVVGVSGLEVAEGRYHLPDRMEAVTDPWPIDCFIENVCPYSDAPGERLCLISGAGVDVEVRDQQA